LTAYNYDTDTFNEDASFTDDLNVPWTELQEHRWDWHPDITRFYQDGQEAAQLTVNIPQRVSSRSAEFNLTLD